jgi:hypothetical protein
MLETHLRRLLHGRLARLFGIPSLLPGLRVFQKPCEKSRHRGDCYQIRHNPTFQIRAILVQYSPDHPIPDKKNYDGKENCPKENRPRRLAPS